MLLFLLLILMLISTMLFNVISYNLKEEEKYHPTGPKVTGN